jgi:predicted amidohydrolase
MFLLSIVLLAGTALAKEKKGEKPMDQNLIKNPGFEEVDSNRAPLDWIISSPRPGMMPLITPDDQVKLTGTRSLSMTSRGDKNCLGKMTQKVALTGGQTYLFSAQVKTQNILSLNECVVVKVVWLKDNNAVGMSYVDVVVGQQGEWTMLARKLEAQPEANGAEIHLEFRWSENGRIWWDQVSLVKTEPLVHRKIKAGTIYCWPQNSSVENNLKLFGDLLDQAGAAKCDIVCLPEGWATVSAQAPETSDVNRIPGSASRMLSEKAKKHRMYIVAGLFDRQGDVFYNLGVLFDRQGNIIGKYKKTHLPNSEVESGSAPGSEFPVFQTDFGTIGMEICWDHVFPEVARSLALNGAEMIFCPIWGDIRGWDHAKPITENENWPIIARTRAMDNGVFFVGSIYHGHSIIIDPAGKVLAETKDKSPTVVTAEIDLDFNAPWEWLGAPGIGEWKRVWRKDRRPQLYRELVK